MIEKSNEFERQCAAMAAQLAPKAVLALDAYSNGLAILTPNLGADEKDVSHYAKTHVPNATKLVRLKEQIQDALLAAEPRVMQEAKRTGSLREALQHVVNEDILPRFRFIKRHSVLPRFDVLKKAAALKEERIAAHKARMPQLV